MASIVHGRLQRSVDWQTMEYGRKAHGSQLAARRTEFGREGEVERPLRSAGATEGTARALAAAGRVPRVIAAVSNVTHAKDGVGLGNKPGPWGRVTTRLITSVEGLLSNLKGDAWCRDVY